MPQTLKEMAQDEGERVRQEYNEALFALEEEVYRKKQEQSLGRTNIERTADV